jgi:GntR family transcriptional regulator/MocR family aminotransferase
MRTLYGTRREALEEALERSFGDRATLLGAKGGMHLMARIRTARTDQDVVRRAAHLGVALTPASGYHLVPAPGQGFILGFSALTPARIREGVRRLATVF